MTKFYIVYLRYYIESYTNPPITQIPLDIFLKNDMIVISKRYHICVSELSSRRVSMGGNEYG